jgi:hypothetical protein
VLLFAPVLSGGVSNGQEYSEFFQFNSGAVIIIFCFLIFFIAGFPIYLNNFNFNLNDIILLSFIFTMFSFSLFGNIFLNRDSKFSFLLLSIPVGILVSRVLCLSVIAKIIFFAVLFHSLIIFGAAFFLDFIPFSDYFFTIDHLNKFNNSIFVRSSGLFLNNNSLGSGFLLMVVFCYVLFRRSPKVSFFIIFISILTFYIAQNFTGLFFLLSLVLFVYLPMFFKRLKSHIELYLKIIFIFMLITAFYFFYIINIDLFLYKFHDSGSVKIDAFFASLNSMDLSLFGLFFGGVPGFTESSLIDFAYYFGPLWAILFSSFITYLIYINRLRCSLIPGYVFHYYLFYICFLYLLIVQNSVFLPVNLFLFGLIWGCGSKSAHLAVPPNS